MDYKINFKKSVERDLKRISKDKLTLILEHIQNDFPQKIKACPALKGRYAGLRKYRIGDYRVIFSLDANIVLILRIQHRREVYRS